jgi:hypothetical protein
MAQAAGREGDGHAADRGHEVDDRQQPPRLVEARARFGANRGQGRRCLADMERSDHAGQNEQADQVPRSPPRLAQYCTRVVMAPSTMKWVPLTNDAGLPARKATQAATSCGVPIRPIGLRARVRL